MERMIVEPKSLLEIPDELIGQKESYDVDRLRGLAGNPAVTAWTFRDAEGPIGFAILIYDALYNVLTIDTLVIDRARRSIPMLHAVAHYVFALARGLAEALGAKRVLTGMRGARAMTRWFPELKVLHTTIGFDIEAKEALHA